MTCISNIFYNDETEAHTAHVVVDCWPVRPFLRAISVNARNLTFKLPLFTLHPLTSLETPNIDQVLRGGNCSSLLDELAALP